MPQRKICVVTGTRADYGLLSCLMKELEKETDFELQIIVTGAHLSPEFGLTYKVLEQDGFTIHHKIEMLLSSDTPVAVTKSIGLATIGFADALSKLNPDLLIVLGDRYEIWAAVQAALIARIPIAHIAGGDITEGAFDDAIRHSITKMSHLHFVTNDASARIVRQLGEAPEAVFNVGSLGIDSIKQTPLLGRQELEDALHLKFRAKNILVTFHPATLDLQPATQQFEQLLAALTTFGEHMGIIFTKPNADTDGRGLIRLIDDYVSVHPNAQCFTSLGQLLYLNTAAQSDAVVGNSSSGLYEIPSLMKPTVNIGDRQKGRLQATSVIQCKPIKDEIQLSIHKAFDMDCSGTLNPYGDGNTAPRIVSILKGISDYRILLKKSFYKVDG
jgi:UDP-hydrolysing UDP-N-acetyl-D-glucosamine 2-epimerase